MHAGGYLCRKPFIAPAQNTDLERSRDGRLVPPVEIVTLSTESVVSTTKPTVSNL